jgi:CheY-like chemotaxis protein
MARARVLCVDDNSFVLAAIQGFLESAGYSVVTSTSGAEALALMGETFNAAVVDYEMPHMNGGVVAKRLREKQKDLPVVMCSGSAEIPASALQDVAALVSKGSATTELLITLAALTITAL